MEIYVDLMHAFTNLLNTLNADAHLPIGIHEELIPMTGYDSSTGTFTVDTTLGTLVFERVLIYQSQSMFVSFLGKSKSKYKIIIIFISMILIL